MHDLNRNSASLESTENVCYIDCGCQNHSTMPVCEALATEKSVFVSVESAAELLDCVEGLDYIGDRCIWIHSCT